MVAGNRQTYHLKKRRREPFFVVRLSLWWIRDEKNLPTPGNLDKETGDLTPGFRSIAIYIFLFRMLAQVPIRQFITRCRTSSSMAMLRWTPINT